MSTRQRRSTVEVEAEAAGGVVCQVMVDVRSPAMGLARGTGALRGMKVRPATWACHHADLNGREEFLGIGVEMHVPRPT